MSKETLRNLSWSQRQVLAAKCFNRYCEYYCIKDEAIDKLLEHLYSIEEYYKCKDLATWERNGANLELAGRGDPLPKILEEKIPKDKMQEFCELLEYTVEVGLCDMYSIETNQPYEFLLECLKILERNKIKFY